MTTRLNDNASYNVVKENPVDCLDLTQGIGLLKDQHIEVKIKGSKELLLLRFITYKDPQSGKVLKFLTNHFDYQPTNIALIYRNRWAIEPFFKQLIQNYQLSCFFSDSKKGIMSQIWIALIANLIFTIIYQRNKQAESFVTVVSMARSGLNIYICFLTIIKPNNLNGNDRNNKKIQL